MGLMKQTYLRQFTLVFLILLSIVLTTMNFTGRDFNETTRPQTTTTTPQTNLMRSKVNFLTPSQILLHSAEGIDMLNTQSVFDLNTPELMAEENLSQLQVEATGISPQQVYNSFQSEPTIVYTFDQPVPFFFYSDLFEDLDEDLRSESFDFMIFPRGQTEMVRFYNSENQTLYTSDSTGEFLQKVTEQIDLDQMETREVSTYFVGGTPIYLPVDEVEVANRYYYLERIPNSIFIEALFDETSQVNPRHSNNILTFTDFYSQLKINEATNLLTYEKQHEGGKSSTLTQTLNRSLSVVNNYENWTLGLHYNDSALEEGEISFRRYVEGYPTFANHGEDVVRIRLNNNELTYLQVNMNVAQAPIISQEQDDAVTLMKGPELMEKVNSSNLNQDSIDSIRIGLKWSYSDDSKRVAEFRPTWFIRYENIWHELDELLED